MIAAMPLANGESEHWFDYHAVSSTAASRPAARQHGRRRPSGASVADFDGDQVTITHGGMIGRSLVHHVIRRSRTARRRIATTLPIDGEDFDAWAVIDQASISAASSTVRPRARGPVAVTRTPAAIR
jgi:hypothetical protein